MLPIRFSDRKFSLAIANDAGRRRNDQKAGDDPVRLTNFRITLPGDQTHQIAE